MARKRPGWLLGILHREISDTAGVIWERARVGAHKALDEALKRPERAVKLLRDLADAIEARQRTKEAFRGTQREEKEGAGDER